MNNIKTFIVASAAMCLLGTTSWAAHDYKHTHVQDKPEMMENLNILQIKCKPDVKSKIINKMVKKNSTMVFHKDEQVGGSWMEYDLCQRIQAQKEKLAIGERFTFYFKDDGHDEIIGFAKRTAPNLAKK